MQQTTINQRLKFLIDTLSDSVRAFSEQIGESTGNTNNYIGSRQLAPKHEYLAKVLKQFSNVDAYWLLTGEGQPFKDESAALPTQTNISGKKNAVNISGGKATQRNNVTADFERERDTCRAQLEGAQREIALLRDQLAMKDALIAAKDEMLVLLRGGYNRPN